MSLIGDLARALDTNVGNVEKAMDTLRKVQGANYSWIERAQDARTPCGCHSVRKEGAAKGRFGSFR